LSGWEEKNDLLIGVKCRNDREIISIFAMLNLVGGSLAMSPPFLDVKDKILGLENIKEYV
jgi:hypothetical protein